MNRLSLVVLLCFCGCGGAEEQSIDKNLSVVNLCYEYLTGYIIHREVEGKTCKEGMGVIDRRSIYENEAARACSLILGDYGDFEVFGICAKNIRECIDGFSEDCWDCDWPSTDPTEVKMCNTYLSGYNLDYVCFNGCIYGGEPWVYPEEYADIRVVN